MRHIKLLSRIIFGIWGIACIVIFTASSDFVDNDCGAILHMRTGSVLSGDAILYDFTTGISLTEEQSGTDFKAPSPNEQFSYDIPWYIGNDNDVFLISNNGTVREQVYSSPFITSVLWSSDSQSLLIWEFDGTREITSVTSIDINTQEQRFRHEFPPTLGRRRLTSPDNRYIYAQYPLDVMQFTYGIVFVDTVTGVITRFDEPTEFPYVWSGDNRWVASHFQDKLNIINPITGDFHLQFPDPIFGENLIWHNDEIWFTNSDSVWQANLNTGAITLMIENAHLQNLSADASWATIENPQTDDTELYHFATSSRYPLRIAHIVEYHHSQVSYSPNNSCGALLVTAYQNPLISEVRIINLHTMQTTHLQELNPDYSHLEWVQID